MQATVVFFTREKPWAGPCSYGSVWFLCLTKKTNSTDTGGFHPSYIPLKHHTWVEVWPDKTSPKVLLHFDDLVLPAWWASWGHGSITHDKKHPGPESRVDYMWKVLFWLSKNIFGLTKSTVYPPRSVGGWWGGGHINLFCFVRCSRFISIGGSLCLVTLPWCHL